MEPPPQRRIGDAGAATQPDDRTPLLLQDGGPPAAGGGIAAASVSGGQSPSSSDGSEDELPWHKEDVSDGDTVGVDERGRVWFRRAGDPANPPKAYASLSVADEAPPPCGCGAVFTGLVDDLIGWCRSYRRDWAVANVVEMFPVSMYIFFISLAPALTFGERLADVTHGQLGGHQVLAATGLCGLLQAIIGGQPLIIVGVSEPIVIVLAWMYQICDSNGIPFQPWLSVTLLWTGVIICVAAALNLCNYIHRCAVCIIAFGRVSHAPTLPEACPSTALAQTQP